MRTVYRKLIVAAASARYLNFHCEYSFEGVEVVDSITTRYVYRRHP